jgi:HEAT repeat protein
MTESSPPDCVAFRALISPGLDGALSPGQASALERHAAACAPCREAQARLAGTVALLRKTTLVDPLPDFVPRLEARLDLESAPLAETIVNDRSLRAVSRTVSARTIVPVKPERSRFISGLKVAASVVCFATSTFLFMEAMDSRSTGGPNVAKAREHLAPESPVIEQLAPVERPAPPPPPPVPPPVVVAPPPIDEAAKNPVVRAPTDEELTRALQEALKKMRGPGGPFTPEPIGPDSPPPPPFSVPAPVPPVPPPPPPPTAPLAPVPAGPPVPVPATLERTPAPTVASKTVDEGALGRLLGSIFKDPSTPPARRAEMIVALGDFPHRKAYEALATILAGSLDGQANPLAYRAAAYEALGALGTEEAARTLLATASPDSTRLLVALSRVKDPKVVVFLSQVLVTPKFADRLDVDVSVVVARALGRVRMREAVPGLGSALASAKNTIVRCEAALALGAIGDTGAVAPLEVGLHAKLPALRGAAARGLGLLAAGGDAAAARALVEPLAKDEHPFVRETCALALGRSKQPDIAEKPLVERLDGKKEGQRRVRVAAASALVELTGKWRSPDDWRKAIEQKEPPVARLPGVMALQGTNWPSILASGEGTVIVLDRSGSMADWNKMVLARKTCMSVLESLPETAQDRGPRGFSVVCFADAATAFFPRLVEPTPDNLAKARAGIERQQPYYAQTDLLRAIKLALSIEGTDTLVVVTDGVPTLGVQDPEQLLLEVSRENAGRGARIHVVALEDGNTPLALDSSAVAPAGESPEVAFLRRLALDNAGVFVKN